MLTIILKLITSFFLTVLPITVLIRDWKFKDKRTKNHLKITRSIVILWFIVSIAVTILVWFDTHQIDILYQDIQDLKNAESIKENARSEKIKIVAQRAQKILMEGDAFILKFLSKYGKGNLYLLYHNDTFNNKAIQQDDKDILEQLKESFMSTNMLGPSILSNSKKQHFSELTFLEFQINKIYIESETILQHYGDIDNELIIIIDEIHNRSRMLSQLLPLLTHVSGGGVGVFGNGVPEQYAEFFSYYFLAHLKCKRICYEIIN